MYVCPLSSKFLVIRRDQNHVIFLDEHSNQMSVICCKSGLLIFVEGKVRREQETVEMTETLSCHQTIKREQ